MKDYFKIIFLLISSFFSFNVFGQFSVTDIYVLGGYQNTKFDWLPNNVFVPNNANIDGNEISGLKNLGFGIITKFKKDSKLSLDLSFESLLKAGQSGNIQTFKTYEGGIISNLLGGNDIEPEPDVTYDYSFEFNSFILSMTPTYNIYSKNKYYLDFGMGVNYHKVNFNQTGVNYTSPPDGRAITSNQGSQSYRKDAIGLQTNINMGVKLLPNLCLDLQLKYRRSKIEDIGSNINIISNSEGKSSFYYPVFKTTVDYSGFNYMLRLRYRLSKA